MSNFKSYHGRVPACGVFCGGCPTYTRERKPCPGADINIKRCEGCTTFHLCCKEKGILYNCSILQEGPRYDKQLSFAMFR